jgi:hypothetical protein
MQLPEAVEILNERAHDGCTTWQLVRARLKPHALLGVGTGSEEQDVQLTPDEAVALAEAYQQEGEA